VLQLHKTEEGKTEYGEFLHASRKKFTDFGKSYISSYSYYLASFLFLLHIII